MHHAIPSEMWKTDCGKAAPFVVRITSLHGHVGWSSGVSLRLIFIRKPLCRVMRVVNVLDEAMRVGARVSRLPGSCDIGARAVSTVSTFRRTAGPRLWLDATLLRVDHAVASARARTSTESECDDTERAL